METININAESVKVFPDGDTVMVTLQNVELETFLAEFNIKQILDCLEFADVADYVTTGLEENEDVR